MRRSSISHSRTRSRAFCQSCNLRDSPNGSTTSYAYDNVGNLQSVTYPNGVVHAYTYDPRNRLTNLGVNGTVGGAPGAIAGYTYTLDAAGHRVGSPKSLSAWRQVSTGASSCDAGVAVTGSFHPLLRQ